MKNAPALTRPYLHSRDPEKRGLACLIAGYLNDSTAKDRLSELMADSTLIQLYTDGYIHDVSVGSLAEKSLART